MTEGQRQPCPLLRHGHLLTRPSNTVMPTLGPEQKRGDSTGDNRVATTRSSGSRGPAPGPQLCGRGCTVSTGPAAGTPSGLCPWGSSPPYLRPPGTRPACPTLWPAACGPGHVPRQDAALLSEASHGTFGWSLGGGWRAGAPGASPPTRHHRSPHRLSANRPEQSSSFLAGRSQPPPWVGRARTPGRDLLTGGSSRGFGWLGWPRRARPAGRQPGRSRAGLQG